MGKIDLGAEIPREKISKTATREPSLSQAGRVLGGENQTKWEKKWNILASTWVTVCNNKQEHSVLYCFLPVPKYNIPKEKLPISSIEIAGGEWSAVFS